SAQSIDGLVDRARALALAMERAFIKCAVARTGRFSLGRVPGWPRLGSANFLRLYLLVMLAVVLLERLISAQDEPLPGHRPRGGRGDDRLVRRARILILDVWLELVLARTQKALSQCHGPCRQRRDPGAGVKFRQ